MMTLSILGLYRRSPSLFDDLSLPEGVNRDTLISGLLTDTAELEVLYPDPEFFRYALGIYSRRRVGSWQKWHDSAALRYNPLDTYDRTEEWEDIGSSESSGSSVSGGESDNRESRYPYDSPLDPTPTGWTSASDNSHATTEGKGSHCNRRSGRVHGNTGGKTFQQLVIEERRVADPDIYQYLIDDIARHFTVGVW